jgi:hypothetical protein
MFAPQSWMVLLTLLAFSLPIPARLEPPKITYNFGDFLRLSGKLEPASSRGQSYIYMQIPGVPDTFSDRLDVDSAGEYSYDYPLDTQPLRAFTTLVYWVETTDRNGSIDASPPANFFYEDNRYQWYERSSGIFVAHWYQGDASYGQMILDIAASGLQQAWSIVSLPEPENVKVYAYANAQELRQALQLSGQNWVGAHADPDLNVMLLSIPQGPEQRLEMERQVPHELMHILLYQKMGNAYASLPMWLNEGLATMAELYPNPDYSTLLDNAIQNESLLSIHSLCHSFPGDAPSAYLAYAESGSFVRYLHESYGKSGLTSLLQAYQDGVDCELGVETAFDQNIDQLESNWRRQTFGEVNPSHAFNQMLPWLLILLTVLAVPTSLVILSMRRKVSPEDSK